MARTRKPNLILRRIREEERQQTRSEFAESLARKARELGEQVWPSERYVARLEDGEVRYPHAAYRRVLTELCGRSIAELGFSASVQQGGVVTRAVGAAPSLDELPCGPDEFVASCEWPGWFGSRLARVLALVGSWDIPGASIESLQVLLHEEIAMFDAAAPAFDEPGYVTHALGRRQALTTLAALPLAYSVTGLPEARAQNAAAREFFLARCAASVTACWHLLRGSDLQSIGPLIETYLLPLEDLAAHWSRHQRAAASLASQAHRICGIVALHRYQMQVRERHCKRALHYAAAASDASSKASALISLASTYFYMSEPASAAAVYERALALEAGLPQLQRSRVHAELAVVYGQLSREPDALRSAGLAEQLYPDQPEQDPSFLYAEFTPGSLALEQGLAYLALAEKYPGRGYEHTAADVLARLSGAEPGRVPDRIRFEVVNNQARAAVLLDDLDAFEAYLRLGLDGAARLGSRQRRSEAEAAWRRAADKWPREKRIGAFGEQLQIAAAGSDQEPQR